MLAAPHAMSVLTAWRLAPLPLLALLAALTAYVVGTRRLARAGEHWPTGRTVTFVLAGCAPYAVVTQGFLGTYAPLLRWSFTAQAALLLLVVPPLIALGRPLELARRALGPVGAARLDRFVRSRPVALLGHPVVGPVVLLAAMLTFLTPGPVWVQEHPVALAVTQVALPLIGLLVVLPVAEGEEMVASSMMAIGLLIAFLELVADALPGILLRLHSSVIGAAVAGPRWLPSPLHDQQLSGDVLWFIGEAIDLPFLAWLLVRWMRADQREAAAVDARLDAAGEAATRPWWVQE